MRRWMLFFLGWWLCQLPAVYALHPYRIDFKAGSRAGDLEHTLVYSQIAHRSITNGILRLEILPEEKQAGFSLTGSSGELWVDFQPKLADFKKFGELRFKARVTASGLPADAEYVVRVQAKTDAGNADWRIPIRDLAGKEFREYRVDLMDNPHWQNASNVNQIVFFFYPENAAPAALIIEFASITLTPQVKHCLADKLAQVDDTKIDFLDKARQVLKKAEIGPPDLDGQVARFKEHISRAKEYHQSNDIDKAWHELNKAEELHAQFYPRIQTALELRCAGERLAAMREVAGLYQRLAGGSTYNNFPPQADKNGRDGSPWPSSLADPSRLGQASRPSRPQSGCLGEASLPSNAPALEKIGADYRQCVQKLAAGGSGLDNDLAGLNKALDDEYSRLDRQSPWHIPIRLGLSQSSCGRFSWMPADFAEGLLVHNLLEAPNVLGKDFNNHTKLIFSSPAYSKIRNPIIKEEKKEVSWVFFRRNITFKSESGRDIHWDYLCSLLAPGVILRTDADVVTLTQKRRIELAPTHMMIQTSRGAEIVALTEKEETPAMTENWMLLLWPGREKYNPCLLVFERKPEKISVADKKAQLCRKDGIGHVGIVDYAGVMAFDQTRIDQWLKSIPAEVPAKCRRAAGIMLNYPVACKEFYGVDGQKREIFIRNEISYYSIKDEWNGKLVEYAPLPPLVAYTDDKGYPVEIRQKTVDFDLPTKYGPFRAAEGNIVEYRIPSPDFNHVNYFRAAGSQMDERKRAFIQWANRGLPRLNYQVWALPAWNVLNQENRRLTLEQAKINLRNWRELGYSTERGITTGSPDPRETTPYFRGPDPHTSLDDRIEPFTEKYYLATGWTTKYRGRASTSPRCYGDFLNGFGLKIIPRFYYYAKYSGDWDYVRQEWQFLKKIFRAVGAMSDWANLAVAYFESGADNYRDMGPDSFKVPVCFIKLAQAAGDRETWLEAKYLAAKAAINRLSFFTLPDYMQAYSETAQGGDYCLYTGVGEFGCDVRSCANEPWQFYEKNLCSMEAWSGNADFVEDFDFIRQYPQYPRRLAFAEIPRRTGWPATLAEKGARDDVRYLSARAFLGDKTEDLWAYFARSDFWLNPFASRGQVILCFAILQGRAAPLFLVDWEPGVLLDASYDYDRKLAAVTIETKAETHLKIKSYLKPSAILQNGRKIGEGNWRYDSLHKELILEISEAGHHEIEISYH